MEVPASEIGKLCEEEFRQSLIEQLKEAGFRFVTLDLEGFRSGSLNTLVPIETLTAS